MLHPHFQGTEPPGIPGRFRLPTAKMREVAQQSGTYVWPITGRRYPRIQIVTVEELLSGKQPDMPPALLPYLQAKKLVTDNQLSLGL
jgi:hypothetical protein